MSAETIDLTTSHSPLAEGLARALCKLDGRGLAVLADAPHVPVGLLPTRVDLLGAARRDRQTQAQEKATVSKTTREKAAVKKAQGVP